MKTAPAILLLSFATAAFARAQSVEQAIAPGCGKGNVRFDNHAIEDRVPPGMKLHTLDRDEAQLLMSKYAFSTASAKK